MVSDAPFADAWSLFIEELPSYLPPEKASVADYAAANRWLDNRGGGFVGRWDHDQAPYLIEPMEVLTSRDFLTTVVVGPARSGKTAIGQNWMLQSVGTDPADFLVYMQTDDAIESYVKREINPMIDTHDVMRERLGRLPVDRSLHFKRFRGMWIEFLAASYSNMISKSAPRLIVDEPDAYSESLGDALALADLRRRSYGRESMLLATSHPDRAGGLDPAKWQAGIMKAYGDSDRRIRYWPCPHCNDFSAPNPAAERVMQLDYPHDAPLEEIEEKARLICPSCGSALEDHQRRLMDRDGVWVGQGETIAPDGTVTGEKVRRESAGFWITGLMSPFLIGGIGELARNMVRAQRHADATGEDDALRSFVVKSMGLPYDAPKRLGSLDAQTLIDRADPALALGIVPEGVRFLTVMIDVQANRFERLTVGWGEGAESWIIDHRSIPADPALSPGDWDDVLQGALASEFPLADDSRRVMRVLAVGFDSGGAPGVTEQAYSAWRRARARRQARVLGVTSGREGWTLLPMKGIGTANASRLAIVYPDSQRKDRHAGARGDVPLGQFNANVWKDAVTGRLAVAEPGPLYVHIPAALKGAEPPHQWFEQLVAERRLPSGSWTKVGPRNEVLDLMVGAQVIAHLHGLSRMDWSKPPMWARPWSANSLVGAPSALVETAVRLASVLAPAPAKPQGFGRSLRSSAMRAFGARPTHRSA